ncbi:MAG: exonuclease domain-containing protein [Actinomycetaceae bacterium]|nr:exonuclease domain-containing protein [Actinomycetaceae bacterium]
MQPFVAIDFETANEQRRSACAIAAVRFDSQGRAVEELSTLLRPHESVDYFNPINTYIHGITDVDVKHAPQWSQVEPSIRKIVGDLPIVAHNMAFDGYVLSDLADLYGLEPILNRRFCTVRLARRILADVLETKTLPDVFGYYFPDDSLDNHHDASFDANACGRIFARMQLDHTWDAIEELCPPTGAHISRSRLAPRPGKATSEELISTYGGSDILSGQRIAITGTLERAKRTAVQELIIAVGGSAENNVTAKTTMLVVGTPNPRVWVPGASASRKLDKARQMRATGRHIEVLTEEEFFNRLLD